MSRCPRGTDRWRKPRQKGKTMYAEQKVVTVGMAMESIDAV